MLTVRLTTQPGLGQVQEFPNCNQISELPAWIRTRINYKTAAVLNQPETAALEPGDRAAGLRRTAPKVEAPPPPAKGRGPGGRFLRQH